MSSRRFSRLLTALFAGASLAACSDGSGPAPDLTAGTFLVAPITFAPVAPYAACVVPGFSLEVQKDQQGTIGFLYPDSLSFTCDGSFTLPLFAEAPMQVGDSLEVAWSDSPPPDDTTRTLVLRWVPGSRNLTGRAVFDVTVPAPEASWTASRQ